jgi:xanthine dehydrogenase accessory factor
MHRAVPDRAHAPIGLPLGGNSPGEIAISIPAEVIGIRYETSQPA